MTSPLKVDPAVLVREAANLERIGGELRAVAAHVEAIAAELMPQLRGQSGYAAQAALARFQQAHAAQMQVHDEISSGVRTAGVKYASTDEEQGQRVGHEMHPGGKEHDGKEHKGHIQQVDDHKFKEGGGAGDPSAERTHNQEDAFRKVFGRAPTSKTDWETAAALDPHSYDPKYQGVPPEVRVVRIRPVPGQGEVRVSQWIEQRDVTGIPPSRDMGDNRRANPNFDPENTRVTTYVDYENGIVVMRQNPSIQLAPDGGPGQVKVGVPQGSVTQLPDGSVRVKYDAGNPFAPGLSAHPPEPFHPWTVNGDLVVTPGPGGVHVDGTRTDYPSMEVYQDLPNGSRQTVLVDPGQSARSWGPFANLPGHHDVGIGGRAFEPFDRGGWSPRYDVRVPFPSTDFGSESSPPSVPPLPPGKGTPV